MLMLEWHCVSGGLVDIMFWLKTMCTFTFGVVVVTVLSDRYSIVLGCHCPSGILIILVIQMGILLFTLLLFSVC